MYLYDILGVDKKASSDEIKAAWRKFVKHHPDEELFKQQYIAYDILTDSNRRKYYDETGRYEAKFDDVDQMIQALIFQMCQLELQTKAVITPDQFITALAQRLNAMLQEIQQSLMQGRALMERYRSRASLFEGNSFSMFLDEVEVNLEGLTNKKSVIEKSLLRIQLRYPACMPTKDSTARSIR